VDPLVPSERERLGWARAGEFSGSVLLQIGQRSKKRLWRQNVGIL
jgi:hypothetical protein